MSMTNAEKSQEYTLNLFIWSKYEATAKQLGVREILKIQATLRAGAGAGA